MADYLAREQAPLKEEQWEKIDSVVIESAKKRLIGRKIINITGPLGAGAIFIPKPMMGSITANEIEIEKSEILNIDMIRKDFKLKWRDIEMAEQYNMPLEMGPVAAAAAICAQQEDEMIFNALINAKGVNSLEAQAWTASGNAFQNVVSAIEKLSSEGFYGPYAMAVSPALYAMMHRVYQGSGVLEISMVKELVTDGVFQSHVLKSSEAILLATGRENFDLVIGQDLITAYLGPEGMDHTFMVFETAVLRIKRSKAICVFSMK